MAAKLEPVEATLSSRIQSLLFSPNSQFQTPYTTNDVMRFLGSGYMRRDVSRVLYMLEKDKLIERVKESPPTWISYVAFVTDQGNGSPHNATAPVGVSGGGASPSHQSEILEVLIHSSNPRTATDVANEIGLRGAAAINSDLNLMEREGLLRRVFQSKGPILWELTSRPERAGPSPNPKIMSHGYNTRSKRQSSSFKSPPQQSPPNVTRRPVPPSSFSPPASSFKQAPLLSPPSSSFPSSKPSNHFSSQEYFNAASSSGFNNFSDTQTTKKPRSLILQYLSACSEEKKASSIAYDLGNLKKSLFYSLILLFLFIPFFLSPPLDMSRHEVNSILYGLESEGLVQCLRGAGPPFWALKQTNLPSMGRGAMRPIMDNTIEGPGPQVCTCLFVL